MARAALSAREDHAEMSMSTLEWWAAPGVATAHCAPPHLPEERAVRLRSALPRAEQRACPWPS